MIQNYKNSLLKVIAWMHLTVVVILILLEVIGIDNIGLLRVPELILVSLGILIVLTTNRRSNMASWILSIYLLLSNIIWMGPYIDMQGKTQTNLLFPLPFLWAFLIGKRFGSLFSAVTIASLLLFLHIYDWDWNIFGPTGYFFLFSFIGISILTYTVENIREKIAQQSGTIAETDTLTGLTNRSGFFIRLESAIMRAEPFYLVQMDLDNFRKINLVLGSAASDQLLVAISQRLRSKKELMDLCRHYGDGFAWIYERPYGSLEKVCIELQNELQDLSAEFAKGMELSVSFGTSRFPEHSPNCRELWSQAELALQRAKSIGKKRLCLYQVTDESIERSQIGQLEALRQSIHEKTLQVHFQPKICVATGMVCGLEALARWTHPNLGYVPPGIFIPIAERHGLIGALGSFVLEESITALAELRHHGYHSISIAVNVSSNQLAHPNFEFELVRMCDLKKVPYSNLWLEITESVIVQPEMRDVLLQLRNRGFRFSLDDFGTGYSSLSYLTRFPFDELKVDKSFTDVLLRSEKDRHIFKTILQLSEGLGMATVIEGVESREQVDLVTDLGATQIQGWFFARAMPLTDCIPFLQNFQIKSYY